jgi:cysteine synthase B
MKTLEIINNQNLSLTEKSHQLDSFIGQTPLYPIENLNQNKQIKIFAKLEWQQFGGSVKSRPAYRIITDAITSGELTEEKHLLDASSGNTGIAYAHIGAALGIPVTLCLPENASEERKQILRALDVDLRLTSRSGGTDVAQEVAQSMYKNQRDKYYYADQYSNPSNWKAHYDTTGPEILNQTNHEITHFIAGLGTTGTFTGTGKILKEYDRNIRLIGLQPDIAMHGLEGWKHLETAHMPGIYDNSVPDEIRTISTDHAHEIVKQTAREEGLIISPSSAANLAGALELSKEIDEGVIVTIFPDDGSKYGEIINQLF